MRLLAWAIAIAGIAFAGWAAAGSPSDRIDYSVSVAGDRALAVEMRLRGEAGGVTRIALMVSCSAS